jgi:hypothetical protein
MSIQTIASFDLGIKNLSYCVASFDSSGSLVSIDRWANLNLLADGADSQTLTRCSKLLLNGDRPCGGPASWSDNSAGCLYCKKCAKKAVKPSLVCEDMTLKGLRAFLGTPEAKKMKKDELLSTIGERYLMPYKAPKAKGVTLQTLLASMERCMNGELVHLARASRIRLENQPSEFAPHMKSIQIMLFVLIDHRLRTEYGWNGTMEFVNASVKTRGTAAGVGKDAKRSRKLAGIAKVIEVLTTVGDAAASQLAWWRGQAKQDDLADAFLMCLDAASVVV